MNQQIDGVAIIGMVGRFPGADTVEALWENLCAGQESTTRFTEADLDPSLEPELLTDPHYVKARGIIATAERFDAAFFGISPREAEMMDPQARLFLEICHQVLEQVGYVPKTFPGLIGLYAGCGQNTYFERHLCGRPELIDQLGAFQTMLANEKDFLATRVSYKLNLTGPSVSVNTACSTSLVAVIQAFHSLVSYQSDLALAGGISVTTPQNSGYLYQEGGMLSPDGHCRPFDAQAQGTLFSNGAGVVVLKRLAEAQQDGDRIYAVIRGVGLNNDGADKVSFTAPSINGQIAAILMAQAYADIHPETLSYIEAHGTATPLGDPIELAALTQAFRTQTEAKQFCAIGSIKGNLGHLVAASGVAGLIKTALALYHRQIPPSLHFDVANPEIDLANSPFYVNTQLADWQAGLTPRRAGVSSFGVGGTNAHVVLEEAPDRPASGPSRPVQLLLLSAKTAPALEQATLNLKQHFQQHPELNLADAAYTLQLGRQAFNHRRFVVCGNPTEAVEAITSCDPFRIGSRQTERRNPDLVFMFPGQGSQYIGMGYSFYQQEPVFRAAIDRCAEILKPLLDLDLRQILYPNLENCSNSVSGLNPNDRVNQAGNFEDSHAVTLLKQTLYTQPALFAIEYALAKLWQSWGIQPVALVGHSIGEFVAACLAGVFSLEDGLKLVASRASLMTDLPTGSMLSVRLPAAVIADRLPEGLAIAASNGPSLCVVSGTTPQIAALQQQLELENVICKLLHTSHAFHSPMMQPVIEPFTTLVKSIPLAPPQIPILSTVTADWLTEAEALDPLYWAGHLRATVRFAEAVQALWQQPDRVLLEVGPRNTLATLARQQTTDGQHQIAIASLGSSCKDNAEWIAVLQAVGHLWLSGVAIDWSSFSACEQRLRIPLPTYPFERQRYWIDPVPPKRRLIYPTASVSPAPIQLSAPPTQESMLNPKPPLTNSRPGRLMPLLREMLEQTSGLNMAPVPEDVTFLEVGLDSLALTQVALALKQRFKVKITFRNLLEDYPTLATLATFLDRSLPPEDFPAAPVPQPESNASEPHNPPEPSSTVNHLSASRNGHSGIGSAVSLHPVGNFAVENGPAGTLEALVAQQLQIMARQLELLTAKPPVSPVSKASEVTPSVSPSASSAVSPSLSLAPASSDSSSVQSPKLPGPAIRIEKAGASLSPLQQEALDRIIARYTARTSESKRQAQAHRAYLADPRTVSGFTPLLKELIYPVVVDRSAGSKLWDVDGNEYIDITNGFGANFFGWSSDFITEAIKAQLDQGIEIGPQSPLTGKVARLISELTGQERVAFCNTGSEAVMAALRLARTVTGRSKVALFAGAYHGTFDEVVIRAGANGQPLPAAPGILPEMVENALVLDYGSDAALEVLRAQADDLAAILVEPVQSRRPDLQPIEFLRELRQLTEQSETALIIDEVVTGFRVHPGGVQKLFGIQADLATYGKVLGGGLPIGVVAGKAEFMDALDGGFWQYGDGSFPEVGVTFFAGTFVRHPMALAAAAAVLTRLKEAGPELQAGLAAKVEKFATHLNQHFERVGAPVKLAHFSSFFYIKYPPDFPYGSLLYYLLREKGIHIWEYRPCFFSLAHTDAEIEQIMRAFKDSVAELQMAGFLPAATDSSLLNRQDSGYINGRVKFNRNSPPQPGARLGKDPEGNPAWFVPDPERLGKYLQVSEVS